MVNYASFHIFVMKWLQLVIFDTTKNSHITWDFFCKFVKTICKKRLFPAIFYENFNW